MIANPSTVVLTAHVTQWADDEPARMTWLAECLDRHNTGDWGDLDPDDTAANNLALRRHDGRLLSSYPVPAALTDGENPDGSVWVITDDLSDTDPLTTVLWPSDY